MSYSALMNAIVQCELAGKTFKLVSSSQEDAIDANGNSHPTLKARIDEYLGYEIPKHKGDDGADITNIEIVNDRDLVVTFSDGKVENYVEIFPDEPYSIGSVSRDGTGDNFIEIGSDGDERIISDNDEFVSNDVSNLEVLASGDVKVSYSDGNFEEIGEIDFYDVNPLEKLIIDGDFLYYEGIDGSKVQVKDTEGNPIPITGDAGDAGNEIVSVEQTRVEYDKVYFRFNMSDGTTIPSDASSPGIGPALVDIRVSEPEDVMRHDYTDGNLTFFIPETGQIELGSVNGKDGIDADDGIDAVDGELLTGVEVKEYGSQLHYSIDGQSRIAQGTPKIKIVPAKDTKLKDKKIDSKGNLIFTIGTDLDGDFIINAGKVRSEDGVTPTDIRIENGEVKADIEYMGKTKTNTIGDISYNALVSIESNPAGQLKFTLDDGTEIFSNNTPNGDDGMAGAFVDSISYDEDNEMNVTITLTDGTVITDIGKVRPIQSHTVSNVSNEIVFNFDGTDNNIGDLRGDPARNASGLSITNNDVEITYDRDGDGVIGTVEDIAGIEYDHSNSKIVFSRGTYDVEVPYTRPLDGSQGKWMTEIIEDDDGRITAKFNDSQKSIGGGSIHKDWPVELYEEDGTFYTYFYDQKVIDDVGAPPVPTDPNDAWLQEQAKHTVLGQLTMVGVHGEKVPKSVGFNSDGDLTIDYMDDTIPTDVIDGLISKWVTDAYSDGDDILVDVNYATDPINVGTIEDFDGFHGVWVEDFSEEDNGEITIHYSDETTETLTGTIHGTWPTDVYVDDGAFYSKYEGEDATKISDFDIDGVDGAKIVTGHEYNNEALLTVDYEDGADDSLSVGGVWVKEISTYGDDIFITTNESDDAFQIGTIDGFYGVDGRWISSLTINPERELEIQWNDYQDYTGATVDGEKENLGIIDGEQGNWITSIIRDGDDVTIGMRLGDDIVLNGFSGIDGIESNWIESMEFSPDDKDIILTLTDGTVLTVEDVQGTDGEKILIDLIKNEDTLSVVYDNAPDEVIAVTLDGKDYEDEITDIRLVDNKIEVENIHGGVVESPIVIRRPIDSSMSNDELTFTFTDIDPIMAGDNSGKDVDDGVYPINVEVVNEKLYVDYSDPTAKPREMIGEFIRKDITSVELVDGLEVPASELKINFSDNSNTELGVVKGIGDDNNIVESFINNEGKIVLTFSDDRTTRSGERVQGLHGTSITETKVNDDGYLIFVTDEELVDAETPTLEFSAGYVKQDLGFAPFDITREKYDRGESCTEDGNIYVSLNDGVTSRPSPDNSEWAAVRLDDDANFPDASRPTIITPKDDAVHDHVAPFLQAGTLRNYYSVDERSIRYFQVDLADNVFKSPIYDGEENSDGHQVEMDLTEGIEYKWRCRDVVKQTGYITDWSLEGRFTVLANGVFRPTVNNDMSQDIDAMPSMPTFSTSPYIGGSNQTGSVWQVKRNSDDTILYDEEWDTRLNIVLPFGILAESTDYSVRVKHLGDKDSTFSDWLSFTTDIKLDMDFKPIISIMDGDLNDTTAKPYFKADSFLNPIYNDYMDSRDLYAEWEVRKGSSVVWSQYNQVDVLSTQVRESLKGDITYKIRLRYHSERFFGESLWSDYVEFTPRWSIRKPTIATALDVTAYPVDGVFTCDDFKGTNEEHFGSRWEVRDATTNEMIHSSYNSFTDLFEWKVSFGERDSLKEYEVMVKHLGRYGESEWSDPVAITMTEIIEVSVYTTSVDNSVRRINNEGSLRWLNEDSTATTNDVAVDDERNAYSVSDDMIVRKINEYGNEVWIMTHDVIVTAVGVDTDHNVYIGDTNGLLIKLNSEGVEEWRNEEHTAKINAIAMGTSGEAHTASDDKTVHKVGIDGERVWSHAYHSNAVLGIAVDVNGGVYTSSSDNTVIKVDYRRFKEWEFTGHTSNVNSVSVNTNMNVFTASTDNTAKMLDETGAELWSYDNGVTVTAIDSDYQDRCYIGSSDNSIKMINSNGEMEWEYLDGGGSVTSVTTNQIPVLMKPVNLKGMFYVLKPPLNLRAF